MWFETVPMLKVLVLKSRFVIPDVLQCPRDTVLSQSHCNFVTELIFLDASYEAPGRGGGLCILEQISSLFYMLLMDPIQCYLELLTNYRNCTLWQYFFMKIFYCDLCDTALSCYSDLLFVCLVWLLSLSLRSELISQTFL